MAEKKKGYVCLYQRFDSPKSGYWQCILYPDKFSTSRTEVGCEPKDGNDCAQVMASEKPYLGGRQADYLDRDDITADHGGDLEGIYEDTRWDGVRR